jgi:Fe-S-cluster containining protein
MGTATPLEGLADGFALCRTCGMCCAWALFGRLPLRRDETGWASSRHVALLQRGNDLSIRLPCAMLEVRGTALVCADYAHRPVGCRHFECQVLSRYLRGELSTEDAGAQVHRLRELVTSIETRLRGARAYPDIMARLQEVRGRAARGEVAVGSTEAEVLTEVALLEAIVAPAFRWPEEHGEPVEAMPEGARDLELWRRLLGPLDDASPRGDRGGASPCPAEDTTALSADGFVRLGPVLAPAEAADLRAALDRLAEGGWAPVYLLMHPGVWRLAERLEPWIRSVLGDDCEMLSRVRAWHGALPKGGQIGRDHVDRDAGGEGGPRALTVWIALADASAQTGCVYVVPRPADPHFGAWPGREDVHDVRNVLAVPAPGGSALAWDQRLLRWWGGGDATSAGLSFEWRRAGTATATPVVDRLRLSDPLGRLELIGRQLAERSPRRP